MKIRDKELSLILSQYDIGAGKKGAADGPKAVKKEAEDLGLQFGTVKALNGHLEGDEDANACGKHIEAVLQAAASLSNEVQDVLAKGGFPLLFSGDHSNAIGGLSGLKSAFPDKRIGVIWVDAHADLHSPYTTPSGNMHGMPLAALSNTDNLKMKTRDVDAGLASSWQKLKTVGSGGISPKFDLRDLVFIGIRDAEKQEWSIIDDNHIRFFQVEDIKEHGIYYVINKSLSHLEACDILYVSFDVDALDPSVSIGTGTTSPDGLRVPEAESIFKTFLNHPKTGVFEITEVNPHLDEKGREMAKVAAHLLHFGLTK